MIDITRERRALVTRLLEGPGQAPPSDRQAAFEGRPLAGPVRALLEKVVRYAFRVTDEDVAAAKASGQSEDQLFELVVCGAVGQATRQYEAALAALAAATKEDARAPGDPR